MSEIVNPEKGVVKKATLPRNETTLKEVAHHVVQKWEANPDLVLHWTTFDAFKAYVSAFQAAYSSSKANESERDPITMQLDQLDQKIDQNAGELKVYLQDKYGKKTAPAYYSAFGFEYAKNAWLLPRERSKRTDALNQIVQAIQREGFSQKTFGLDFWNSINAQYGTLVLQAATKDGSLSSLVAQKKQLRESVIKHLNALIHLIKANYPDDAAAHLRDWGFQKEKY